MHAHVCGCLKKPEEDVNSPTARAKGGCELLSLDARNCVPDLCKNIKCS